AAGEGERRDEDEAHPAWVARGRRIGDRRPGVRRRADAGVEAVCDLAGEVAGLGLHGVTDRVRRAGAVLHLFGGVGGAARIAVAGAGAGRRVEVEALEVARVALGAAAAELERHDLALYEHLERDVERHEAPGAVRRQRRVDVVAALRPLLEDVAVVAGVRGLGGHRAVGLVAALDLHLDGLAGARLVGVRRPARLRRPDAVGVRAGNEARVLRRAVVEERDLVPVLDAGQVREHVQRLRARS